MIYDTEQEAGLMTECVPSEGTAAEGIFATQFAIDSESAANWYLRKLAGIRAERELVQSQVATIFGGLDAEEKSLTDHFGPQFEQFVASEIAAGGGKTKNRKFLYGTAQFRTVPARWSVTDKPAALEVAKVVCPHAVSLVTTEVLDTKALTTYAEATGDLVPGVELIPARESFSVTFSRAKDGAK